MGFWSGLCSFVNSVVDVVSSVASKVGNLVADGAKTILSVGKEYILPIIEAIEIVGKLLGVLKSDDNIEEMGEIATLSDKKPEDYDSIEEYIEHLRNDIQLDKSDINSVDDATKLAYKALGASIISKGIEVKLDTNIPIEFWKEVVKQKLEAKSITKTIEAYKSNDLKLDDYGKYMSGELDISQRKDHSQTLINTYKELNPNLSDRDIDRIIFDLKSNSDK